MARKRSSFCSVAVLKAGAWLCMTWAFLSQHMDYNILFVLSLMSWEKSVASVSMETCPDTFELFLP